MSLIDFVVILPVEAEVQPTSEFGTPMRRSYVVPMRWMVMYEYLLTTQTMVTLGILHYQGKIPILESGIEPAYH
jgi:hypothetical protein